MKDRNTEDGEPKSKLEGRFPEDNYFINIIGLFNLPSTSSPNTSMDSSPGTRCALFNLLGKLITIPMTITDTLQNPTATTGSRSAATSQALVEPAAQTPLPE